MRGGARRFSPQRAKRFTEANTQSVTISTTLNNHSGKPQALTAIREHFSLGADFRPFGSVEDLEGWLSGV